MHLYTVLTAIFQTNPGYLVVPLITRGLETSFYGVGCPFSHPSKTVDWRRQSGSCLLHICQLDPFRL